MKRKQALLRDQADELEGTLQFFLDLIDPGKVGIWEKDLATNRMSGSSGFFSILGNGSPKEFVTDFNTFLSAVHPDDLSRVRKAFEGTLETNSSFDLEFRIVHPGASEVIVRMKGMAILGPDSMPVRYRGAIIDYTARKHAEERLDLVVHTTPDAVIIVNEQGTIINWNHQAESIFGWSSEEAIGRLLSETILPERYRKAQVSGMKHFLETGEGPILNKLVELFARRKNGEEFPIELKISSAEINNKNIFIGFARDVTRRKEAEAGLKDSKQFVDSILDNIPNMLFVKDAKDLRYVRLNRAGLKLLGLSMEQMLGKNDYDFFPKEQADFFTAKDREVIEKRELVDVPEEPIDINGERRWLHTKKICIADEKGKPLYLLGISEDITEQKKAVEYIFHLNENLNKKSQDLELANHELESFSYSVAHDLRTPVRAFIGFGNLLEKQFGEKLGSEGMGMLHVIIDEAMRMGHLIDDLLAFSRLGKKEIQKSDKVDMTALAKDALAEFQKMSDSGYHAQVIIADLASVRCDPYLIHQVWTNLISNAIKYSHLKPDPQIEISSSSSDGMVTYSVKDNGVGFDMKYADKLFGVFQRLHRQDEFTGSGIGLAIVKRIVSRHGGLVMAQGKVDEGAVFSFSLPV
jgi:PAS domain S-box-containing protein